MSLRFIVGKSGSGKTFRCLEEMASKQKAFPAMNFIYTVPEQNTLSAEKKLIAHTEGKCIMNAKVLSFKRLSYRVFAEMGYSGKTLLGEAEKLMAIRRIAAENADNLEFFTSIINSEGVLDRIDRSIVELMKANISPEGVDSLMALLDEGSAAYAKLKDLKYIYAGYLDFLKEGYSTVEEELNVLAEKISSSEMIKNSEIWIDGFYSFSPQELKIIEGMLLNSKRVSIVLNMDKESFLKRSMDMSETYFEPWTTADNLCKIAEKLNVPIEDTLFLETTGKYSTPGMKSLQKNFDKAVPEKASGSKGVYIFEARDKFAEVEDTAEKINALVRKNGFRYRDIGVLSREVEDYSRIIKGTFEEYAIPAFIDKTSDIREHTFIKMILSVFDALINNLAYEDVFSYVKTGLSPLTDTEGDILENYVLKYGIKGRKYFETWYFGFEENDPKKDEINSARERLAEPFSNFYDRIKPKKTYKCEEIADAFTAFLDDIDSEDNINTLAEAYEAAGDKKSADEMRRVYKITGTLTESLKKILGQEPMNLKEFAAVFEAGLSKCDLGIVPPENDMVTVGDLERTRLNDVKILFVLGVNDGVVPKAPEPIGVFSDSEAELLEEKGFAVRGGKRSSFEENYLIYMGLMQPGAILRLSYCLNNSEGKELRPSSIINKIKRIFPDIQTATGRKYENVITMAKPSMHKLAGKLSSGEKISPAWEEVLSMALEDERYSANARNMLKAREDSAYEKDLSAKNAEKLYGNTLRLSATGMSLYAGCPFAYFVKYGLKAKERDVYEVKAPDLGTIFHGVLKDFADELERDKISWADISKEEMEKRINAAVDRIAPDYYEKVLLSKGGYRYLINRLKKVSAKACWALGEHIKRGSFRTLGFEVGFGKGEALPPIAMKLDSGKEIIMQGKIDRVDVFEKDGNTYVKIIDYKSSGKNLDIVDIYYGIELQLMIYMAAFMDTGSILLDGNLIPGGVFYFAIKTPMKEENGMTELTADKLKEIMLKSFKMDGLMIADEGVAEAMDSQMGSGSDIIPAGFKKDGKFSQRSKIVTEEEFDALLAHSRNKFKEIGEEIYSGRISPSPYKFKKKTACDYCLYKSICGFDPEKKSDKFRILKEMDKTEAMEKIKEEARCEK